MNRPCGIKPNRNGYGRVNIDGQTYLAHRIVWLWHYGFMPGFIDHIDRNRMNNLIENLRDVSISENSHNRSMNRNNTSGYTGVIFNKRANKFMARIWENNKQIHLGLFNTREEAFLAYMLAKIKYHPTSPIAQEYLRELTLAG